MNAPHSIRPHIRRQDERGFTLIELMVGLVLIGIVAIALSLILIHSARSRGTTMNQLESTQSAAAALNMISQDVRSAGYGADEDEVTPQPAITYVDSMQMIISENLQPYPDVTPHTPPLAYDPGGAPKPFPLNGTTWQPPMKYHYGAELVRYTMDLNNDGVVNAADLATIDGTDAARTKNPNDYVLVRQVYGDSTGNVAGNNGGSTERIAIVSKPGGAVPPMFNVYMRGTTTPYDWSGGPVPATQLGNIERVDVQVSSPSSKPDWRGNFANTVMRTSVSTMRNSPVMGPATFPVDGYVYDDQNHNQARDAGEPGLGQVNVRLGNLYTTYTASNGYFYMKAQAGTYALRHTPPIGYGVYMSPDSFVVSIGAGLTPTRSFPDTARAGGHVSVHCFNDVNSNGVQDMGETPFQSLQVTMTGGDVQYTDASGNATLFAPVGGWSCAVTQPDSLVATTPNPVTGSMTNGGTASIAFGFHVGATGKFQGTVYRDNNRNGVMDGTDTGIANVYVAVTPDAGMTILGYAFTDANGRYSITVPINDPPHTRPYSIFYVVPNGFFPVGSTSKPNQWIQAAQILTGKDFGVGTYQVITLNASRVLSLAAADLIEKDWNGNQTQNARADKDLVLGADAGGTDNVSVWFNNYNGTPLFTAAPTYTRNAPNSVMALAVDTLNMDPPIARPDVVTGTKITASGNLFVWFNQNTSGNLGFIPTTYDPGQNYRTQDGGDVQAVLTFDCAGGSMPDIIAGTKSPTSGMGTIEIWQNSDAVTPTFTRQEVYPSGGGSIPGNRLGEVTAMAFADINNDGRPDLIVGTRTGPYTGELLVFQNASKINGARFICRFDQAIFDGQVTSLATADIDRDGQVDVIVGVQESAATGSMRYFHNKNNILGWNFDMLRTVPTPGIPTALKAADYGGGTNTDIAMGWRATDTSYGGGVLIYYTDVLNLPFIGTDPSAGSIANFVPALACENFNYGVQPSVPLPPFLTDLACGVKSGPTTGALVIFIR